MQRDQGVIDEALEKLASQVHIELADVRARERNMVVQAWTAGKIDDDARQCFVQRHIRMAVAAQSGLVAHGCGKSLAQGNAHVFDRVVVVDVRVAVRSEEHTSELQSLMRISYAVFCLKKKKNNRTTNKKGKKYKIQKNQTSIQNKQITSKNTNTLMKQLKRETK